MAADPLLRIGLGGTVTTALCCFTPILPFVLGGIGLGAAVAWLDLVLLPLLAAFILVLLYALARRKRFG
ncbi:MAG: mercury resistance system transport protein MerF [Rhodobacteraceae bacterium]|nr:mercury resistance system transport protein MerF [Paracoccaceae bacterium]